MDRHNGPPEQQPEPATLDPDVAAQLTDDEAATLAAATRPSARLMRDPNGPVQLGGDPQLPEGHTWPCWGGVPLDFLADVDLAAIADVWPDAPLPDDGHLLFFAKADLFGPGDEIVGTLYPGTAEHGWDVVHLPAGTPTVTTARPDGSPARFQPVSVVPTLEQTMPDPWSHGDVDGIDPARHDAASAQWHRMRPPPPYHRVGGHPDPVQGDPAAMVAIAEASRTDPTLLRKSGTIDFDHPDLSTIVDGAASRWWLLLQLDTDTEPAGTGWMWGDAGVMYFHVEPERAAAGDFSNVWLSWDCH